MVGLGMTLLFVMSREVKNFNYDDWIGKLNKSNMTSEEAKTIFNELRTLLEGPDSPVEQPYGKLIAGLLDPNPKTRMADTQLAAEWPGVGELLAQK